MAGYSVPGMTTVDDRLSFFSGSADLPVGQGVHERVTDATGYHGLAGVRHWRRMLSNFWRPTSPWGSALTVPSRMRSRRRHIDGHH